MPKRNYQAIVGRAMQGIYEGLKPPVLDDFVYGAIDIDPGLLTIQCLFANGDALREAQENGTCDEIKQCIKAALKREKYPKRGIDGMIVGFASLEDVNESGGPWHHFR